MIPLEAGIEHPMTFPGASHSKKMWNLNSGILRVIVHWGLQKACLMETQFSGGWGREGVWGWEGALARGAVGTLLVGSHFLISSVGAKGLCFSPIYPPPPTLMALLALQSWVRLPEHLPWGSTLPCHLDGLCLSSVTWKHLGQAAYPVQRAITTSRNVRRPKGNCGYSPEPGTI